MGSLATQDTAMSQLFFEAGPQRTLTAMENLVRHASDAGLLDVPDPRQAANNFFSLLQGCEHMRVMTAFTMTACEAQPHAEQVVDMFLRAAVPQVPALNTSLHNARKPTPYGVRFACTHSLECNGRLCCLCRPTFFKGAKS